MLTQPQVGSHAAPDSAATFVAAFERLRDGQELGATFDYKPRTLRMAMEDRFPSGFAWTERRTGEGRWEIVIRKLPATTSDTSIEDFLPRCSIFANAERRTLAALARAAVPKTILPDSNLAEQGVAWPHFGVVRTGRLFSIAGTPEGREQLLFEFLPREAFGELIMFDHGATAARFVTIGEPADVLIFPQLAARHLAESDPQFALSVATACALRGRSVIEMLCAQISKPAIARVAAALIAFAPGDQLEREPKRRMLRPAEIAAAAGTVQEVAARALAKLEECGAIRRERGRIVGIDPAKLNNFL
jgi:CRP/FNR family transcriptional regulator, dissimilatory nitrate respiration regulator